MKSLKGICLSIWNLTFLTMKECLGFRISWHSKGNLESTCALYVYSDDLFRPMIMLTAPNKIVKAFLRTNKFSIKKESLVRRFHVRIEKPEKGEL